MPHQVARFGPDLWQVARGCANPFQCDDTVGDTVVENIFIPETLWSDLPAVHVGAEWQPVDDSDMPDDICQEHMPVLVPPRHLRKWTPRISRPSPWKQESAPEVARDKAAYECDVDDELDDVMDESSQIFLKHRHSVFREESRPEVVVPDLSIDEMMLRDAQAEAEARAKVLMEHAGFDGTSWDDKWAVAEEECFVEADESIPAPMAEPLQRPLASAAVASAAAAAATHTQMASRYLRIDAESTRASEGKRVTSCSSDVELRNESCDAALESVPDDVRMLPLKGDSQPCQAPDDSTTREDQPRTTSRSSFDSVQYWNLHPKGFQDIQIVL